MKGLVFDLQIRLHLCQQLAHEQILKRIEKALSLMPLLCHYNIKLCSLLTWLY